MAKSQYIVEFGGLSVGVHDFEFEIDDKFFKSIENSEVERASINVDATLTRQNNLLNMHFSIYGTVGVECDRCLKNFDLPIEAEEELVIKYGNPDDSNDEILVISEGETQFNVSQYLYEYIALALPVRRVPCEVNAEEFECDWDMRDKIEKLSPSKEEEEEKKDENKNNPMWEQLNKIKKFNQN